MPQAQPIKIFADPVFLIIYFRFTVDHSGKIIEQKIHSPIPDPDFTGKKTSPPTDTHGFFKGVRLTALADVNDTFKNIPMSSKDVFDTQRHVFQACLMELQDIRRRFPSEENLANKILTTLDNQYPHKKHPSFKPYLIRLGNHSYATTRPDDIII